MKTLGEMEAQTSHELDALMSMDLHEKVRNENSKFDITRVPDGWIYSTLYTSVFVPEPYRPSLMLGTIESTEDL